MKAFNNTNKAAQSPVMSSWEYEAEKRQEKKATKQMRSLKQGRKGQWISGE